MRTSLLIACYAAALIACPTSSFQFTLPNGITSRKSRANNNQRRASLASLVFDEGTLQVPRGDSSFSLYYRVYNSNSTKAPIVMCHGGPSLPSQYLYPVATQLYDHPVIFFDQLGCGKSDEPKDLSLYSIQQFVGDLQRVVVKVVAPTHSSFHLFGHSFGGVLAFEFLRSYLDNPQPLNPACQSVILSNTPTNLKQCNDDYDRLYARNPLQFWKKHACQIGIPPSLQDAMNHAGKVWVGMDMVADYRAEPLVVYNQSIKRPQVLIVSCTRDFAFPTSNEEAWKDVIPSSYTKETRFVNFEDCAHYPIYEDEAGYGQTIRDFLSHVEGPVKATDS